MNRQQGKLILAMAGAAVVASTIWGVSASSASVEKSEQPSTDAERAAQQLSESHDGEAAWAPAPAAPGEVLYPEAGLRTLPAPEGVIPAVDRTAALDLAKSSVYQANGWLTDEPDVQLRTLAVNDFSDSTAENYGPVWVLTYANSPDSNIGGKVGEQPSLNSTCTFTYIVDAAKVREEEVKAFRYCGPK